MKKAAASALSAPALATAPGVTVTFADIPSASGRIITGGMDLAERITGERTPSALRFVYRLSSETPPEHRPPIFKLGGKILACREDALVAWMQQREALAAQEAGQRDTAEMRRRRASAEAVSSDVSVRKAPPKRTPRARKPAPAAPILQPA